ncbi:MAG: 3D domain-containing protein [Candidatus Nitrosotenuis sp.]
MYQVLIFVMILVSFMPGFAGEFHYIIPKWFDVVYQYWNDGQITDEEFENAISYLQRNELMWLVDKEDSLIADFLVTNAMKKQIVFGNSDFSDCSAGWYVTGYFTPLESDYSGKFMTASINDLSYKFREDFVEEIKMEGWGRTISGNYLGWYGESFHLSEKPLDAAGNSLVVNAIAVDPSVIPASSKLTIPSLPSPWDMAIFTGSDTGIAIIGKHIDVYTGEGKNALDEAYRITGYDNTVCLEAK